MRDREVFPSGFMSLSVLDNAWEGIGFLQLHSKVEEVMEELRSFNLPALPTHEVGRWSAPLSADGRILLIGNERRVQPFIVEVGSKINVQDFARQLVDIGFNRVEFAEKPGEFAIRGGILDIVFENDAYRILLLGDEVEEIREFSPFTQLSTGRIRGFLFLIPSTKDLRVVEIRVPYRHVRFNPPFGDFRKARDYVGYLRRSGYEILFAGNPIRLALFEGLGVKLLPGNLYEGFVDDERKKAYIGEWEILGARPGRRSLLLSRVKIKTPRYLESGDYVVHEDYGIGVFLGLERREVGEVILLQYSDGRLSVPVYKTSKLSKYVGPEGYDPPISSLNRKAWEKDKAKALLESSDIARRILNLMVERRVPRGYRYTSVPKEREFWATFPYDETEDQRRALEDILGDLESDFIMERLLIGEVAFGKTEVALRAAFRVLGHGRSVVWLVPSTLLAQQHYRNFLPRLKEFGMPVYVVSRLMRNVGEGPALYVGTHALLRMKLEDVGLVVVDEEQHFGVLQKEHFKALNPKADYLYLSATPIPRTLALGLEGIVQVSYLRTPPPGRLPVITYIGKYDDRLVIEAINRELKRNGQVFYVFNRIEGLEGVLKRLRELLPGVPMEMLHGRMPRRHVRRVMEDFYEDRVKVLVSTAIVEAGLDFRNANTLIVESPERMGLSQLHQLRGRVGRWTVQAYAYLLYRPPLSREAKKRLDFLAMYSSLGEGYKLAMRDLELRGMGELLGIKQHGKAAKVGFKLYLRFLRRALGLEREGRIREDPQAYIPSDYIKDEDRRIEYYLRLADASSPPEIEMLHREMEDIFGPPPKPVLRLLNLHLKRVEIT
ncbi:MAG: DEAD/DEAH box helicase [Thermotogae bacterium]|nr:DEAD/DEAH box helicase [Thermotogota bacterium]